MNNTTTTQLETFRIVDSASSDEVKSTDMMSALREYFSTYDTNGSCEGERLSFRVFTEDGNYQAVQAEVDSESEIGSWELV